MFIYLFVFWNKPKNNNKKKKKKFIKVKDNLRVKYFTINIKSFNKNIRIKK